MLSEVVAGLFEWQPPQKMLRAAERLSQNLGREAMLRIGTEYREALLAARFAQQADSPQVKLLNPANVPTPDFAFIDGNSEVWFETTEADRPNRRRSDEYRHADPDEELRLLRDDEWTDAKAFFAVVRQLCMQKSAKSYAKCDGLIIYANAWVRDEELMTREGWLTATESARIRFDQVWSYDGSVFTRIS